MSAITIAFCDEDSLSRETIKILLKKISYLKIIGEYENSEDLLIKPVQNNPEILLYDLQYNTKNNLINLQKIINKFPKSKIVAISTFEDSRTIAQVFNTGVLGFLIKRDLSVGNLSNAIKNSIENKQFVSRCCEYKLENNKA